MDTRIEKCLDTNIKDLITGYPEIQQALDKFEIGCAPCNLGTCKLKDVVGIHNLNAENEKKLFNNIFGIIFPGESFTIPRIGQDKSKDKKVSLSPPLKMLVDEHVLIKRILAQIPKITEVLDLSKETDKQLVRDIVDFIKNYADKYHHAKEEDILFKKFDASLDIINVMINDHVLSRSYVANMLNAVEEENSEKAKINLLNYLELLTEHIKKEDTILYPWMDNNLDTKDVGEIYSQFIDINTSKSEIQAKYEKLAAILEE